MKGFLRWLSRVIGTVVAVVLIVVLLPYASQLASAVLPDLSGAALNTSILLSHKMESSARLETTVVEDEGILNSTTEAMFIGQVQSVTMQYLYRASIGIDLGKVQMKVQGSTITLILPEPEILTDSITPEQVQKDDFWYPLTEERRQQLLEAELIKCRERCLSEYAASEEAWRNTVSAMENTVSAWLGMGNAGVSVRYERANPQ